MDILALVPLPVRISSVGCKGDDGLEHGAGVAVCKNLLVVAASKKLQVFVLPNDIARGGVSTPRELMPVRSLGGVAPMALQFCSASGYMAFTAGGAESTLLLVTDCEKSGSGAVHVIDVVSGTHVGYVAAPGTIWYPLGVTTRNSQAAVSCWAHKHVVCVFEGRGATWATVRVIAADASCLRFTADCLRLAVVDALHNCLSIFCAKGGFLLRDIALLPYPLDIVDESFLLPRDMEECAVDMKDGDGSRAGWVMCHSRGLVAFAGKDADGAARRRHFGFPGNFALATVPGLGLVVRNREGVQFFATPDAVAMASMSFCKVAWMAAACRGLFFFARGDFERICVKVLQ